MKHICSKAASSLIGTAFALIAMTLTLGAMSYGQVSTGTLVGTVTDPNGAVIPGCQIRATNTATGEIRSTATDSAGLYSLPSLTPGAYTVTTAAPGFGAQSVTLVISIDSTVHQDFSLSVSGASSTIEVKASDLASLETESHEVATTLPGMEVQELPQTTRNVLGKLDAAPLAQNDTLSNDASDIGFFGTGNNSVNIGGIQNGNTGYLQDGVLNYNLISKTANLQPTPEDVDQVNIQANGASARYDEPTVVNVVTKGGSNQFHGQAYDFLQNDDLDAKGYFDTTAPQQRYNQFGVNLGGPILKNKLLFFFAYDAERQHSLSSQFALVPTQAMFQGNFGTTTIIDPTTGLPFQNNTIPSGQISGLAKAVIPFYPTPTGSYANGTANYTTLGGSRFSYDSYLGRLDYNLSTRDTMYGAVETTNPLQTTFSVIAPSLWNPEYVQSATNGYVQETHTFKPTLVNVARFGYNYSDVYETVASAGGGNYTAEFGVPFVTPSATQETPPVITIAGYNAFDNSSNSAPFAPDGAIQHVYQFADELNQVIGKHSLFYGIEADKMNMNASWVIWNNGEFDFNGQYTGNSVADFLLGYPFQAIGGLGYTYGNFNQWQVMPYVQDDWKPTPRLTLNLGLRYDFYQSPTDANGHAGIFNLATNSVTQGPYSQPHDTLAPRIGFAYALNDKTVVRGGYGIYYSTFLYNELQFMLAHQPNYTLEENEFSVTQPTPIADVFIPPSSVTSALGTFTTAASMPAPQVQQWNLAVQRSIGPNWSASLTYLGNKANHLQQRFNPNQASLPADPANPTPIQTRRPYPNIGDVYEAGDVGWSNFNALQVELVKRFSNGLTLNANYVWSKTLDDQSEDNQNPRDGTDLALDYGPADFDRTQVFKFSDVWDLPIGPGKLIAKENNWFNRGVIGGWQTSEILGVRSGTPFDVLSNNTADIGGDIQTYSNQICSNPYATNRSPSHWLNASCFTQPNGTLGTEGRNSLRSPNSMSLDASASKYFPITERVKVKFAADFLNALNHPMWYFGFGSQSLTAPTSLGVASYLGNTRVIQMSLHAEF